MKSGNEEQYMQGVGIKEDSLGKLTENEMLENLANDVKAHKRQIENSKLDLENYSTQVAFDERIWKILEKDNAIRKIEPTHNFELEEEYWLAMQDKQRYAIKLDRAKAHGQIEHFKLLIKKNEEALDVALEKYEKFAGKPFTDEE